jgi:peroxin-13
VAEQFGNLRNTLGSILGIFTILRWLRTLLAKLTGRPPPADATALTPASFARFEGWPGADRHGPPRLSKKPFFFFLMAAFGLPYLMGKLIGALAATAGDRARLPGPDAPLDPAKLDFCRALYDFTPEAGAGVHGIDLAVRKGDLVAVLSRTDPLGNASQWWRCRARDGRVGYLPGVYLELARRSDVPARAGSSLSASVASDGHKG